MNQDWYAREIRRVGVPGELVTVLAYVLLVDAAVVTGAISGPLQLVVVAPLLVFLPGYALLSLLFPGADDRSEDGRRRSLGGLGLRGRGLAWRERLLLSFGASVVLLPLFGFVVAAAGAGFPPTLAVGVPSGFVVACILLGAARRWLMPSDRAYGVPLQSWMTELDTAVFDAPDRREAVLNAVLVVVVSGAVVGMVAAVASPPAAETYTDLSLLTTTESGEYVGSGYPSSFVAGEPQSLVAAVTNHEGARTDYTMVVELHRLSTDTGSATVLERRELAREQATVAPGETWRWNHDVSTGMLGDELRLTYLLYKGPAPPSPSTDSAYRTAYVWISVSETGQASG